MEMVEDICGKKGTYNVNQPDGYENKGPPHQDDFIPTDVSRKAKKGDNSFALLLTLVDEHPKTNL